MRLVNFIKLSTNSHIISILSKAFRTSYYDKQIEKYTFNIITLSTIEIGYDKQYV